MNAEDVPADTSLELQETSDGSTVPIYLTGHQLPHPDYLLPGPSRTETLLRHSGWIANRHRVYLALQRTSQSAARVDAFACCGGGCVVQHHAAEGKYRIVGNYCHDRFCLPCGLARSRPLAAALKKRVSRRVARMTTLTLRHSKTSLNDQLDRLYSSFRLLRQRKSTAVMFKGGVAFLEVKWVAKSRTWHPHLHIITEGKWVDQKTLSQTWHGITGDSFIVHVTRISDEDRMIGYVTKYASKPMDSNVFADADALDELIVSLKGRRLYNCFGTWSKLLAVEEDEPGNGWTTIGTLSGLQADAEGGDAIAQRLLALLLDRKKPRPAPA